MHVLHYHITAFYNCSSSPLRAINFTHIHFLQILHSDFFQNEQITSKYFFHPFHYSTLHFFCTRSPPHTRFHCSNPPILSRHIPLSENSLPQNALLTAVLYFRSKFLIHTLAEKYCSLKLLFIFMNTFLLLIIFAIDPMIHQTQPAFHNPLVLIIPFFHVCILLFPNTFFFTFSIFFPRTTSHLPTAGTLNS